MQPLPHSIDAEKEVLGTVLVNPGYARDFLAHSLGPDDFYHSGHQALAKAILDMASSGTPIDEKTIKLHMEREGTWNKQSWLMLGELLDKASIGSSLPFYMDVVLEFSTKRHLANFGMDVSKAAHNGETAVATLQSAHTALRDIEAGSGASEGVGMREGLSEALHHAADVMEGRVAITHVPTGVAPLDHFLGGGLSSGHLVVVNTASGHGKTAFAVGNLALSAGVAGVETAIFSLEMTPRRVYHRILAADSAVPVSAQMKVGLDPHDFSRMTYSGDRLCQLPIKVYGTGYNSFEAIRGACMQHEGLGLVVVDYLQLLRSPDPELGSSDHGAIAENMAGFRELSNELECVVALLSQPTVAQRRTGKPPTAADTKGGGSISEAADLILTPWLPHMVDEDVMSNISPGQMLPAEIYVEKNRDGAKGIIGDQKVCFDRARMIFKEA